MRVDESVYACGCIAVNVRVGVCAAGSVCRCRFELSVPRLTHFLDFPMTMELFSMTNVLTI